MSARLQGVEILPAIIPANPAKMGKGKRACRGEAASCRSSHLALARRNRTAMRQNAGRNDGVRQREAL